MRDGIRHPLGTMLKTSPRIMPEIKNGSRRYSMALELRYVLKFPRSDELTLAGTMKDFG